MKIRMQKLENEPNHCIYKKIKLLFLLIWFLPMVEESTKDWRERSDVQIGFQTGLKCTDRFSNWIKMYR